MDQTRDAIARAEEMEALQPPGGRDTTVEPDPTADHAQLERDQTVARAGAAVGDQDGTTATGRDPAEIPDAADEVPAEDLPGSELQPETQGSDPVIADLGEDGEGELSPGEA